MRAVTVYRVDFGWKTKVPIGTVLEQRRTERANNNYDLLRLARKLFAVDRVDSFNIVIDVSQAVRVLLKEMHASCSPN